MERMAQVGWSLGRATDYLDVRYWPVLPLGVFYRVARGELAVVAP